VKINGNEVRVGNILDYQGKLWVVTKTQHTQPGKGGAYMQVEMKALVEGTKLHERFRSAETVERVFLDEAPYQFLYAEGDNLVFMDQETYEQITLPADLLGDSAAFLQDSMIVNISSYEGKPIAVNLPDSVVLEITEAEPVVKGQTASSSYKPAILSNGVRIMVPPHIEGGMRVVVNTSDSTYIERAKE
jgi:elongation factor P